jgi:pimeloyl-ACP methyl ester carboxylesterase
MMPYFPNSSLRDVLSMKSWIIRPLILLQLKMMEAAYWEIQDPIRSGAMERFHRMHFLKLRRAYGFDFTTNLENYSVKVLFLYSENNKAYGAHWAETVSAPFPNVEVSLVENCGHEMLYFGWTDMYPQVLSYLDPLK